MILPGTCMEVVKGEESMWLVEDGGNAWGVQRHMLRYEMMFIIASQ